MSPLLDVRALESAATFGRLSGQSNLFIHRPYEWKVVDLMMTNFHMPRTTLVVLVSTFAGRDLVRRAYDEAVRERYRFLSYGDCMLFE